MSTERKEVTLTVEQANEKMGLLFSLRTSQGNTKLDYAIRRISDSLIAISKKAKKEYDQSIDDLRVEYASVYPQDYEKVEKRGCLISDETGNYSFTREATQAFNKGVRKLQEEFEAKEVTFVPYFVNENLPELKDVDVLTHNKLVGILFENAIDEESSFDNEPKQSPKMEVVSENPPSIEEDTKIPEEGGIVGDMNMGIDKDELQEQV